MRLREDATWVEHTLSRVRALSPRATLLRGYAILSDADGLTIDSTAAVETGQVLRAMLADGTLHAQVTEVDRREDPA